MSSYQQFIKDEMENYGLLSEIQNFSFNSSMGNMVFFFFFFFFFFF